MDTDVLIVGAGPTGLVLAAQLLRAGVRIRLIDKKPGLSTTSKAIGLQYRVSEIFACMGIVDRFLREGVRPTRVNIFQRDRLLVQLKFEASGADSGRDAFSPQAIVIPQSRTEQILGDVVRERGGKIEWNTEFVEFHQDESGVHAHLRDAAGADQHVSCNWLVSCEGAHSRVREQAAISFGGKTYPLAFFLADVELDGPLVHGENYVWMHRDGSFAALPLPAPRTWRLFVDVTKQPPAGELTLARIRDLMIQRIGDRGITLGECSWISEFRIHCRMVNRFRHGRAFLAGDAAHVHSPTGGQGIVTGVQDATNLAWKLAQVIRGAPPDLLDTYEEERLPQAAEVLRQTDRTTRLLLAPDRLTRLFRDVVLLPIMRSSHIQKRLFSKLAQLHVNYRGSRLSPNETTGRRSVVMAGDRAPDVAFEDWTTTTKVTLFELLRPFRPIALLGLSRNNRAEVSRAMTLLKDVQIESFIVTGRREQVADFRNCLIDLHGDFGRLYGFDREFLCIIRPDDHIGLLQQPINEHGLRDYCRWFSG